MAKSGDRAIDKARVVAGQIRIIQPELVERTGLEILDDDIRTGGELADPCKVIIITEIGHD